MCRPRVGEANPLFSLCRALWRPTALAKKKSCRTAEESRTTVKLACMIINQTDVIKILLKIYSFFIIVVLWKSSKALSSGKRHWNLLNMLLLLWSIRVSLLGGCWVDNMEQNCVTLQCSMPLCSPGTLATEKNLFSHVLKTDH